MPDQPFPPRQARSRRRRPRPQSASQPVEFPGRREAQEEETQSIRTENAAHGQATPPASTAQASSPLQTEVSATSRGLSEKESISSFATPITSQTQATSASQSAKHEQKASVVVPIIPNVPVVMRSAQDSAKQAVPAEVSAADPNIAVEEPAPNSTSITSPESPPEQVKSAPKSWAELLRIRGNAAAPVASPAPTGLSQTPDVSQKKANMVGDAIASFAIQKPNQEYKLSFLEPRGLINSGNMCYMNSVRSIRSSF